VSLSLLSPRHACPRSHSSTRAFYPRSRREHISVTRCQCLILRAFFAQKAGLPPCKANLLPLSRGTRNAAHFTKFGAAFKRPFFANLKFFRFLSPCLSHSSLPYQTNLAQGDLLGQTVCSYDSHNKLERKEREDVVRSKLCQVRFLSLFVLHKVAG